MPINEALAERVRALLKREKAVAEIKMFGGLCFTLRGNMCCGTLKDDLIIRVGPDGHDKGMSLPGADIMKFTGRPMKGFIVITPKGYKSDAALKKAVSLAAAFVATLPPKKKSC